MTKYIVNKEFVSHELAAKYVKGSTIGTPKWDKDYIKALIAHGFIEEVKEDTRWQATPNKQSTYWIYIDGRAAKTTDKNRAKDIERHELGNYFKSKETAELVAEALKLFFAYLHEPESNNIKRNLTLTKEFLEAVRKAEQAVLADDKAGSE